jgi:hypothetical protein
MLQKFTILARNRVERDENDGWRLLRGILHFHKTIPCLLCKMPYSVEASLVKNHTVEPGSLC